MKKIISALLVLLLLTPMKVSAASATLNGTSTVRANSTITVTLALTGNKMSGISGEITYDSNLLTFSSYNSKLPKNWSHDYSTSNGKISIIAADNGVNNSLNSTTVATISFKVNSKVTEGTAINIKASGKVTNVDATVTETYSASYSKKVAAPLSANNNLSSLKVSNSTLSPSFSSSVTTYSVSVPYETSKLSITAKAADSKASISIKNNSLKAGATTNVTVVVTAQSGAKKTYTIQAKRGADPNYVASSNNNLTSLKIMEAVLSPVFSTEKQSYIAYVPFEVSEVHINAKAVDNNASITISPTNELKVGNNSITITCIAESGDSKVYNLNVVRAESFDGAAIAVNENIVEELIQQMNKASKNTKEKKSFYLDFSAMENKQLDTKIFTVLKEFDNAELIVNLGPLSLIFNSADIQGVSGDFYNLKYISPPNNQEEIRKYFSNDDYRAFSITSEMFDLPGYAVFSLVGDFLNKEKYYVYFYDEKQQQLVLIAQKLSADNYGVLRYRFNTAGDFIITTQYLDSVTLHESIDNQNEAGWLTFLNDLATDDFVLYGIIGGSAVAILLLGVFLGYLGERKKFRRYIKRRSEEDE